MIFLNFHIGLFVTINLETNEIVFKEVCEDSSFTQFSFEQSNPNSCT